VPVSRPGGPPLRSRPGCWRCLRHPPLLVESVARARAHVFRAARAYCTAVRPRLSSTFSLGAVLALDACGSGACSVAWRLGRPARGHSSLPYACRLSPFLSPRPCAPVSGFRSTRLAAFSADSWSSLVPLGIVAGLCLRASRLSRRVSPGRVPAVGPVRVGTPTWDAVSLRRGAGLPRACRCSCRLGRGRTASRGAPCPRLREPQRFRGRAPSALSPHALCAPAVRLRASAAPGRVVLLSWRACRPACIAPWGASASAQRGSTFAWRSAPRRATRVVAAPRRLPVAFPALRRLALYCSAVLRSAPAGRASAAGGALGFLGVPSTAPAAPGQFRIWPPATPLCCVVSPLPALLALPPRAPPGVLRGGVSLRLLSVLRSSSR